MRIVTWNANAHGRITQPASAQLAFARAQAAINTFAPDIAVFQEVPNPFVPNTSTQFWYGRKYARGIAVCTQPQFALTPLFSSAPQSVFPFRVEGPVSFSLLAVRSLPPERSPSLQAYVREVMIGVEQCRDILRAGPAVIIGDFNTNSSADLQTRRMSHSMLVRLLRDEFNLVSAYHQHRGVEHGAEAEPTFYLYRHQTKPFHVDYCFVPASWKISRVEVGSFTEWRTHSDHCPLVVDVAP